MDGICSICEEPLTTFVCLKSLSQQIKKWLPEDYGEDFEHFNNNLLESFSICEHEIECNESHKGENRVLVCVDRHKSNLCIYCYINEVVDWINFELNDSAIASELLRTFLCLM